MSADLWLCCLGHKWVYTTHNPRAFISVESDVTREKNQHRPFKQRDEQKWDRALTGGLGCYLRNSKMFSQVFLLFLRIWETPALKDRRFCSLLCWYFAHIFKCIAVEFEHFSVPFTLYILMPSIYSFSVKEKKLYFRAKNVSGCWPSSAVLALLWTEAWNKVLRPAACQFNKWKCL